MLELSHVITKYIIPMKQAVFSQYTKDLAIRKDLDIKSGDTVRVVTKIVENGKNTRLQTFEGLVLAVKHGTEPGSTITVRKVTHGIGVERVFPRYSPLIESISVIRRANVRRSKLYFVRDMVSRQIRRKMRDFKELAISTRDLVIPADAMEDEVIEVAAE